MLIKTQHHLSLFQPDQDAASPVTISTWPRHSITCHYFNLTKTQHHLSLFQPDQDASAAQSDLPHLLEQHLLPVLDGVLRHLHVLPQLLSDIHLHCHLVEELEAVGLAHNGLTPLASLLQVQLGPEELLPQLKPWTVSGRSNNRDRICVCICHSPSHYKKTL